MKKLMLILCFAGNVWADDDTYNYFPNYQKQALIQAQVAKDQAIANYLNQKAKEPTYNYLAPQPDANRDQRLLFKDNREQDYGTVRNDLFKD